MFRTRDFVLIFVTMVFLLVAIGSTLFHQWRPVYPSAEPAQFAEVTVDEYEAEVQSVPELSREERLVAMREKIAADTELVIEDSSSESVESITDELATSTPVVEDVFLCPKYSDYTGMWPVGGVQVDFSEGVRLVYTEDFLEYVEPVSATSGELLPDTKRDILVQLPVPTVPFFEVSCIGSDVIGVAQDGSLIRNNEMGLYSVFGNGTLIGYALDGFPIYGVSEVIVDNCGGVTEAGQYRYYLSSDRDTILNCFAAPPVSL